ncbi:hypothetical protein [Halomicronema sp. CCY15110]|uniref:hypothetical protein n=1 Tax=Halomicronema sp. CCY15110 TaxID=2767773 RepID=UPI00194F430E|nr:hypothetical protein [Halomicronema sp. CCY15110]
MAQCSRAIYRNLTLLWKPPSGDRVGVIIEGWWLALVEWLRSLLPRSRWAATSPPAIAQQPFSHAAN